MLPDWLKYDLQNKWERLKEQLGLLGIRSWVNEHPKAVTAVAATSGVLMMMVIIIQLIPDELPPVQEIEKEWYYDLNTGRLFAAEKGLAPPIEAPSGPLPGGAPAGVRAYVLSYSYEPNESERFIGFLETMVPRELAARRPTRASPKSAATDWARGKLVRRVEDEKWVPADSSPGQQIIDEAFAPNADGERPTYRWPE